VKVKGFTVPNELVDDYLCIFPPLALKCYLVIVRKTVGWHKRSDKIPIAQFISATGKEKRAIVSALNWLDDHELIIRHQANGTTNQYQLNLDCNGKKLGEAKAKTSAEKCTGSKRKPVQNSAPVDEGKTGAKKCTGAENSTDEPVQFDDTNRCSLTTGPVQFDDTNRCKKMHPSKDTTQKTSNTKDTTQNTNCDTPKKPGVRQGGKSDGVTAKTWQEYSRAWQAVYGKSPPKPNAKQNGQLANFVKLCGQDDAPMIAVWYVLKSTDRNVLADLHPIGRMVAMAEALRNQWSIGWTPTQGDVQRMQRKQNVEAIAEQATEILSQSKTKVINPEVMF
jgi:hypothetical protein